MYLGFEASVSVDGNTIKTIGDVGCESSYTEVSVKNRAVQEERFLYGLRTRTFDITVQAGTDQDDENSVDGYELLLSAHENKSVISVIFTSPGGYTFTKNMIVTKFSPSDPLDDLSTASVTLRVSAAASSSSSSSGS